MKFLILMMLTLAALVASAENAAEADFKEVARSNTPPRSCYPVVPFNSCTSKNVGDQCFDGSFGTCEVVKKDWFGNLICGCL